MAYTHPTIIELIWIEKYYKFGEKVTNISRKLSRSRQTIYNVINWLKKGLSIKECYEQFKKNKSKCGAKVKLLGKKEQEYVLNKLAKGWTPCV